MSAENPGFDPSELEINKMPDNLTDATGNVAYGLNQSENNAAGQSGIDLADTTVDAAGNAAIVGDPGIQATTEVKKSPEKAEHIPTEEEVRGVFQELIAGPYTESRKREDEQDLYLLEVTVPGEEDGEVVEYSYMRAGRYPEGQASNTRIDKAIYDKDGIPSGGEGVAELIDGEWKIFD